MVVLSYCITLNLNILYNKMEYSSWITYFMSLFILFILGYYILDQLIFEQYEVKNLFSVFLFCFIFAFSLNSLELLIFEILKIGSDNDRIQKWILTTYILSYSLLFWVPSLFIFKFVNIFAISKRKKITIAILIFIGYLN